MKKRDAERTRVGAALVPMMLATQRDVTIISPYFVPGDAGHCSRSRSREGGQARADPDELARGQRRCRGARRILALSQAAAGRRRAAVGAEAARDGRTPNRVCSAPPARACTPRRCRSTTNQLFVGSYNLDPRSTWLNSEQGVLVESAALAHGVQRIFARQTSGAHAWKVSLQDGRLSWSDGTDVFDSDPKAGAGRRFQAWFARAFHLDAQL